MRITKEQRKMIRSFPCERLSRNKNNQELVSRFVSDRGRGLVRDLRSGAWEEDLGGGTAYYLIKAPDGEAALFFSLKCGSLFEPMDETALLSAVERDQNLKRAIREAIQNDGQDAGRQLLEMLRSRNIDPDRLKKHLERRIGRKRTILDNLEEDRLREPNEQIIRVHSTYSGIELVHFCVDDRIRPFWRTYELGHPFGEVMFWQYIAPLMYNMQRRVGCQFAFLFAADLSEDETLIKYYESLKFVQSDKLATNKPIYDLCCRFMYQPVNELSANRKEYFNHFNPNKTDELV